MIHREVGILPAELGAAQRCHNLRLTATDRSGSEGREQSNVRFMALLDYTSTL